MKDRRAQANDPSAVNAKVDRRTKPRRKRKGADRRKMERRAKS
jgi:hypothetical protein